MIKICSKFKPGEEVYTLIQAPVIKTCKCELCEGKGSIEYNNIPLLCPQCKGKKIISVPHKKYTVWKPTETPLMISSINVKYHNENVYKLKYRVCGYKRAEEHLFKTLEEAILKANELNCALINNDGNIIEEDNKPSYHERIIETKYNIGDTVYSFCRQVISEDAHKLVPIQHPLTVNGYRLTLYPEYSVVRYKVDNLNRKEDSLFASLNEVEERCTREYV